MIQRILQMQGKMPIMMGPGIVQGEAVFTSRSIISKNTMAW